ncbi:MAG: type II secretion system F family protein [Bacteroidetes bacterium]|nr:MAG: type II secretion system F family protein [Bacteroidota bacterium]
MPEFRIDGVSLSGKPVQGIINADTIKAAKEKAAQMARERKFKVSNVHPRTTFLYRVKKGNEKPIDGEQKAFTKQEVTDALSKMGYQVVYVRKKMFDGKGGKVPPIEVVSFVRVSADLIRQKLPFNDMMQMMINDIQNKTLREAIREINQDLKQGKDSEKAFQKHEKALGKFAAHMLGLASKSGNMGEIFESTAKFLERNAQFKKDLKSALIMPVVTLVILFVAVGYYVAVIFPETANLFQKFKIELPPMTAATLKLSAFLTENIVWIALSFGIPFVLFGRWAATEKGRLVIDHYIWKIPSIGDLLHKMSIEIFCRVFYALYSGSGENIEVIRMASEACGNKYMESQIKNVALPMMVDKGAGITEAFEASGVFTKTALSRFHSGAETGNVKNTALQLAEYYEKETGYRMRNAIDFIQLIISMIIMIVLTALTLVSSETATVKPKPPGGWLHFLSTFF